MENFWIIVWITFSIIINILGVFINFKINYYKGKWGVKKTPIYRLKSNLGDNYSIFKYELKWDIYPQNDFIVFFLFFLVPFGWWFKFPIYEEKDDYYGSFKLEELQNWENLNLNLEEYYEKKDKESWDKYHQITEKWRIKNELIDSFNEDFNKNYN